MLKKRSINALEELMLVNANSLLMYGNFSSFCDQNFLLDFILLSSFESWSIWANALISFVKLFFKIASNTMAPLFTILASDSDSDEQLPLLSVEESWFASLLELKVEFCDCDVKRARATGFNANRLSEENLIKYKYQNN
jgi:hypothetical protein